MFLNKFFHSRAMVEATDKTMAPVTKKEDDKTSWYAPITNWFYNLDLVKYSSFGKGDPKPEIVVYSSLEEFAENYRKDSNPKPIEVYVVGIAKYPQKSKNPKYIFGEIEDEDSCVPFQMDCEENDKKSTRQILKKLKNSINKNIPVCLEAIVNSSNFVEVKSIKSKKEYTSKK